MISGHDLHKFYGELEVVRGIDLDVHRGECFGFVGPNGAGKTTTIRMIQCFTPATSGQLRVFNMDPIADARKIKALIGVVPQDDLLDEELRVLENLTIYAGYFGIDKKSALERSVEALKFLQLEQKAHEKVQHLSGGMRRRLLIARALINQPRLLILDEPTTGLDPQARHLIWAKIRELRSQGVTLVLTTHYMEEAQQLCDRIVIMDNGKILTSGPPAELVVKYVGEEVVEIHTDKIKPETILERLSGCEYQTERYDNTLFIFFQKGCDVMARIVDLNISEYIHRMATLEDVFLKLTGREIRE